MGVMMQAFHWDCPRLDGQEYRWWEHVRERVAGLARVGFTALWLPPAHKAANIGGPSMGYDPYDYYDLGDIDQKGRAETWFGSRAALHALLDEAHAHGIGVLADMVVNHNNGADGVERNPITGESRWTLFLPGSGRFGRDWLCFHPCPFETWDEGAFGGMPDLSHRNPYVYGELLMLARWLIEEIGFDGFRYDFVKGYATWLVAAIQEYRYERDGRPFKPFGVGENWDGARTIENWTGEVNAWNDNPVSAFDFPQREMLKALCDEYGFSLRRLATTDTVARAEPLHAVTFVENHDLRDEGRPIANDKLLAYAFILTHEGYPCVFWKDYFNLGLALEGTPNGIAALVGAHESFAAGGTELLAVDDGVYVMQRTGLASEGKPGLVFALNNRGDGWGGRRVATRWRGAEMEPVAWWSARDGSRPLAQRTDDAGWGEFWAPPRGYAVYVAR
jgi:alpha-amylase